MLDLFHAPPDAWADTRPRREPLGAGAVLLRGFCLRAEREIIAALEQVTAAAPFRRMVTPGGHRMSVAMTNCGCAGWVTDRTGYRYDVSDPSTGRPWPPMPPVFRDLAVTAAAAAGFEGFVPDACLINRYEPGTRLSLHQDRNERAFDTPIVSVSLGLPATFLFGGSEALRSASADPARARRCRGVGRAIPPRLSRHHAGEGRRASEARPATSQPDLAQGFVGGAERLRGATISRAPRNRRLRSWSLWPASGGPCGTPHGLPHCRAANRVNEEERKCASVSVRS